MSDNEVRLTFLQWFFLITFVFAYIMAGGAIFMLLESTNEINSYSPENPLNSPRENESNLELFKYLNNNEEENEEPENEEKPMFIWNFFNSVFFAFTVITTIGYGHMAPVTIGGRTFLVLYALIGIPVNGVLITQIAHLLSSKMSDLHMQSKEKYGFGLGLTFDITFYVCPGILVFIVIPAGFFSIFEDWAFVDAIYYAFVTVSTIGFGDLVPDLGATDYEYRIGLWLYKGILMLWITIGLSYIVMILHFITKGLQHQWFHGIFGEDADRLIRSSFDSGSTEFLKRGSKDMDYMRRLVNELYIMKIKPVQSNHFEDEDSYSDYEKHSEYKNSRRASWDVETFGRSNHHSFNHSLFTSRRNSHSDSALTSIDKARTFEEALGEFVDSTALLTRVATALNKNVINGIEEAMSEMNEAADQETPYLSKEPQKPGSEKPSTEIKSRRYSRHHINNELTDVVVHSAQSPVKNENISEKPYEEKKVSEVRTRKLSKLQSTACSRRTSRIEQCGYQRKMSSSGPSRKISLETTTIADFLRAMNAVHEKIKPEAQREEKNNKENFSTHPTLEIKNKKPIKKEIETNKEQPNEINEINEEEPEKASENISNARKIGRRVGVSYHNFSYVNENMDENTEENKIEL